MKRFTLAALLAAAMVVSSIAAVHAVNPNQYTVTIKTYTLTPPPGGNFNASGSLTVLTAGPIAVYRGAYPSYHYETDFFVQVWGLAPSREYALRFSKDGTGASICAFTTDAAGDGSGGTDHPLWLGPPQNVPKKYSVVDVATGVVELSN
jgi:hypothetical protein